MGATMSGGVGISIEQLRQDLDALGISGADSIIRDIAERSLPICVPDKRTLYGLEALDLLHASGVNAWVFCGFVSDAYAGRIIRQHKDLDILALSEERFEVIRTLKKLGFDSMPGGDQFRYKMNNYKFSIDLFFVSSDKEY
jgi:hypothetical protein